MKDPLRKVAVITATAFAILSPALQNGFDWGQSASEFSASGDETLRAASYAFSIWGLIYAGLVAFAVWQALPKSDASQAVARAAWPATFANLGIGLWIWATAADQEWLTVALTLASLAAAAIALFRVGPRADRADRMLVRWPFAALAGWLTVAAVINVLTVLTELSWLGRAAEVPAGLVGIAAAAVIALAALTRSRSLVYALPVAWGLIAVFVAERDDNVVAAAAALGAGALVLAFAALTARRPSAAPR